MERRNTKQRQLVLQVMRKRQGHFTADDVYLEARKSEPLISRGTIYRNLNLLVECDEIKRIQLPQADRYDARTDSHHHLLCQKCNDLFDVDLPYDAAIDQWLSEQSGCKVDSHHVIFKGLCRRCSPNKDNRG